MQPHGGDTMKDHIMGIDFGSTTAKTVILDLDGNIVASNVSQLGSVSGAAVEASIKETLEQAGLDQSRIARTVSTGYGRRLLDIVDKSYTEITCHAKGAVTMVPDARMVIDIGGQDSKVIAIDKDGTVNNFAMNDRCAGGTGKFFEVLARAMEVDLDEGFIIECLKKTLLRNSFSESVSINKEAWLQGIC